MRGIEVVKSAAENMTTLPGVYRMIGAEGRILYIGKAKNLKNRVSQYAAVAQLSNRISRMVFAIEKIEVIVTNSESDALNLEAKLVKQHKPPFNIMLRDDKSFPYIAIDETNEFPRIFKYRGDRQKGHSYFGPYPSAAAVNMALSALQKIFLLRPCSDGFFKARTKPCIEYQIKRCSAPCVNFIEKQDYLESIKQAKTFLNGKSQEVRRVLEDEMRAASDATNYEVAAIYRNRLAALSQMQTRTHVDLQNTDEADIIALESRNGKFCIQVFFVRGKTILGNAEYFPTGTDGTSDPEVLEFFLGSFYENKPVPQTIILAQDIDNIEMVQQALMQASGHEVEIIIPQRGEKKQLAEMALMNARNSIERKIIEEEKSGVILKRIQEIFGIEKEINRVEVFDNSHIFGKSAVGAMIVAGKTEEKKWGFLKSQYRKFNVDSGEKETGGDDFDMMRQVLQRRYSRAKEEGNFPEIVLIDGGAGQLSVAHEIFSALDILNKTIVVAIAKGPDRNAGEEDLYMFDRPPFKLEKNDAVLYFLQNMRDEAHRFAITSHRAKRKKSNFTSKLDEIPNIGSSRKKMLLSHFGSARAVENASLDELLNVSGISSQLAEKIYNYFRA